MEDLIEHAAELMGEPKAHVALTRAEATRPLPHMPNVKLHGCFRRDPQQTLWSTRQLQVDPFHDRVKEFTEWLPSVLLERDLLSVGFRSDWSYLNDVLSSVIRESQANRIVLVNPSDPQILQTKAKGLWELAHQDSVEFIHEREYGKDFLTELRQAYSFNFMRRLVSSGGPTFKQVMGREARACTGFKDLPMLDLYEWRRDSTCHRSQDCQENDSGRDDASGSAHCISRCTKALKFVAAAQR